MSLQAKTGLDVIQVARATTACPLPNTIDDCLRAFSFFVRTSPVLPALSSLPLLVGAFIGAPLVARELDQGTYLLAWTQGVPRQRWPLTKLAMLTGLACLGFAVLAGLTAWWSAPIDPLVGPWLTFDVRGLAPFAYAFFALALGAAAGAIIRQTVGAMFVTAAVFVAVRLAVADLRPYYLPPLNALSASRPPWTALVVVKNLQKTKSGISGTFLYQPSDRFWTFQGIESAIFVALAVALLALTLWWMRHRIA